MRRALTNIGCRLVCSAVALLLSLAALAANYDNYSYAAAPTMDMRSVNGAYMSSGSTYQSEVYAVGAGSPSGAAFGPRKAPPIITPGTETEYNPTNPQFSPIGDAVLPLLLMVGLFLLVLHTRSKRMSVS